MRIEAFILFFVFFVSGLIPSDVHTQSDPPRLRKAQMRILSCCFPKSLHLRELKRIKCLGNLGNFPSAERRGDAGRAISGVARAVCIRCGYTSSASVFAEDEVIAPIAARKVAVVFRENHEAGDRDR